MRPTPTRKLTILDGMVLVAAVACGLSVRPKLNAWYGQGPVYAQNWFGRITDDPVKVASAIPFLMTITPAVLVMRLRRPRPRWRLLARQPGTAACCAAIGPIAIAALHLCLLEWRADHVGSGDLYAPWVSWEPVLWICGSSAGLCVLAAWLALAVSGRRSVERSGIDWLGRLVGAGWLAILAVRILGAA
jgi:hypothetical protein